ncbi:MAG: ribosome biogenesis GTPase YlqF [Symbiobacteriia bacterium]
MGIQWYPGHMAKARRVVAENASQVDVILEVLDARVPYSSRNPDIDAILGTRPRIIVLNKSDLADPAATEAWANYLRSLGWAAGPVEATSGKGVQAIVSTARNMMTKRWDQLEEQARAAGKTVRKRMVRAMIVGIPNVGKSSLINRLGGEHRARVGSVPGITTGKQWVRASKDFALVDVPGILWPKFQDPGVGYKLVMVGAIREEALDPEPVAGRLLLVLLQRRPDVLAERYGLRRTPATWEEGLDEIARHRGYLLSGDRVDRYKAAVLLLQEFRKGLLGRLTLETVTEFGDHFQPRREA